MQYPDEVPERGEVSWWSDRKIPKVRITHLSIERSSIWVRGLVDDLPPKLRPECGWQGTVACPIRCRVNRVWLVMMIICVTFGEDRYWEAIPQRRYEADRRVCK